MHRIGCEYFMPAVIIAFPFIKVYLWTKIYRPPSLGGIFFCFFGRCARARGCGKYPSAVRRGRTRGNACGAGFGEGLAAGNCSKNAIFLQLGIKTAHRDQDRAACAETGCFWDSQNELRCKNNGIGEETARRTRECGCFRESQNELRC